MVGPIPCNHIKTISSSIRAQAVHSSLKTINRTAITRSIHMDNNNNSILGTVLIDIKVDICNQIRINIPNNNHIIIPINSISTSIHNSNNIIINNSSTIILLFILIKLQILLNSSHLR